MQAAHQGCVLGCRRRVRGKTAEERAEAAAAKELEKQEKKAARERAKQEKAAQKCAAFASPR